MNKFVLLLILTVVLLLNACGNITNIPQPTLVPVISQTSLPTATPTPTATPLPQKAIPGLLPADIKLNLKGFNFESPQKVEDTIIHNGKMTNNGINYNVAIYGNNASDVKSVNASIMMAANPDIEFAKEFLGFIGTLPYKNSKPEESKKWILNNLDKVEKGKNIETEFVGVNYRLYGNKPFAYSLEISKK